jgi:hypothetical protein
MKHRTATLQGALLDAAVAAAIGYEEDESATSHEYYCFRAPIYPVAPKRKDFRPSTDWEWGGPIIETSIARLHCGLGHWVATCLVPIVDGRSAMGWPHDRTHIGDTPLVAAMRAYVSSRLGDEVELP